MLCKSFSLLALTVSTVVAKPYLHARFHYSGVHGTGHAHGTGHRDRNSTIGAATGSTNLPQYTVTVSALPTSDFTDSDTDDLLTATASDDTTSCTTGSTSTLYVTSTNHVTVTLAAVPSSTQSVPSASSSASSVVLVAAQNVQPVSRSSTTLATSVAASTAISSTVAVSVSTVSSSAAATTTASSSSSSGAKKGIAFNDLSYLKSFSGVGWTYNWDIKSWSGTPSGVEFVPMCWGLDKAPTCYANKPDGAKAVLSFNEPDNSGQSFMSVSDAVANHIKYVAGPFGGQVRIGSPAVTNSGSSGQGLDYLSQFLAGCAGNCKIDFLAIHWYANSLADLQQHVAAAIALGAKYGINKIWITEFALNGTPDEQAAFVAQAVPWLESQPAVERYAYFWAAPFDSQYGMFSGSTLNAIGNAYNG